MRPSRFALLLLSVVQLGGCLVGAAVGAAGTVTGAVVGATVAATGAVIDAALPDGDDEDKDEKD